MNVLVVNTGSSSIKYQLFNMEKMTTLASGLLERIGEHGSRLIYKRGNSTEPISVTKPISNHTDGMKEIVNLLMDSKVGVIKDATELTAIGHRVVHGGELFKEPSLITHHVLDAIKKNIPLAPLHNPANLAGIEATVALFSNVPQVAVFDTAFHQTMPPHAYQYAIPYHLYDDHKIRRYGFHGTSHYYVAKQAAKFLKKPLDAVNLITIHLGNGCSMTAIQHGKSIDTSMGMTPLEGLMMGTRCGDIDSAIPYYLSQNANLNFSEIDNLLNKQSGLKGICGSNDLRDIEKRAAEKDPKATLAIDMYAYRIKKYIGAYVAALGTVDALVFTAGVGENSFEIRKRTLSGLSEIGIVMDSAKNNANEKVTRAIHAGNSKISILVIPTNEELEIAEQTIQVITAREGNHGGLPLR